MSFKKSLALFVTLIAVSAVVWLFGRPGEKRLGGTEPVPLFADLKLDQIKTIAIENLTAGVLLTRDGGRWWVESFDTALAKQILEQAKKEDEKLVTPEGEKKPDPEENSPGEALEQPVRFKADAQAAQAILDIFKNLQVTEPVSINKAKQGLFEIGVASLSTTLRDEQGSTLAHLLIGKNGPDFFSTYVCKASEEQVYLVNQYLKSSFARPIESWRDLNLADVTDQTVTEIILSKGQEVLHLKTVDGQAWGLADGQEVVASDKIQEYLKQWQPLRAAGVIVGKDLLVAIPALRQSTDNITLKTQSGQAWTLTLAAYHPAANDQGQDKKASPQIFVQTSGDSSVYKISPMLHANLLRPQAYFIAQPAPEVTSGEGAVQTPQP